VAKLYQLFQLATAGIAVVAICALKPPDAAADDGNSDPHVIAVFSFVPLDQASEAVATELTNAIIETLRDSARLKVLTQSDLPSDMQNPSQHDQWPKSDLVSFALEGAVRKGANGTSITVQLLNTSSDDHVWSERFESDQADVEAVVSAVQRQVMLAADR
jgi:TolB-like protein